MAHVTILCGPSDAGHEQTLVERYRCVRQAQPGQALWLGPSYRAIEDIRPHLQDAEPRLFTFHDFAAEIIHACDPQARPLSRPQMRLLAEEVVTRLQEQNKLRHFQGVLDTRGFAQTVFSFLTELKQHEIPSPELLEAVTDGDFLFADADVGRKTQCALLYHTYQELLHRHHLYDLEGRLWRVRDLLHEGKRQPFADVRAVFVHGFADFTRTQHEILAALCTWVDELWLTLPDEQDDERTELFAPVRRTLLHLGQLLPVVQHERSGISADECSGVPPTLPHQGGGNQITPSPLVREGGGGRDGCHTHPRIAPPSGLTHLRRELFRPLRKLNKSSEAAGLALIEAPGMVGEARLVARRISLLLQEGTAPDNILVVLRDVLPYADLLHEVFAEYGLPVDIEGTESLQRNPTVSTLLRSLRIPEENYSFGPLTALLRSSYFCPDWPPVRDCADIASRAEALLRLLGEPRGRDAYLAAVVRWAENPPKGLEDEQAEESRRRRQHELAKQCRSFLERFLHVWDEAPDRATLRNHIAWLKKLADDLGISKAAAAEERDRHALQRLWSELEHWQRLNRQIHGPGHLLERSQFQRLLSALADETGLARTPRSPGRIRILSAPLARCLSAEHIFLMGLGERSFPRLATPESFFDEQDRQALRLAGLHLPCLAELLPEEMLLFYQIICNAREQLTFSFPAVDERGQELLPSSFLAAVLACFEPGAIPAERRNMLIEGHDRDRPLSLAEYRVQAACALATGQRWPLPTSLSVPLNAAKELAQLRFQQDDHTIYDGLFRDEKIISEVAKLFAPERILSPTALESYIACPFKFFLSHILRLEPLEEPREEIESTERGVTFHRALSRLHGRLKSQGLHQPSEEVDAHILQQMERAISEASTQSSPAARMLWQLEGQRLKQHALRYRPHWTKFVDPWLPRQLLPRPEYFEVGFGLPPADGEEMHSPLILRWEEQEVRISGRIDRVDVAELRDGTTVFWIIDYKTGRAVYYTGSDLKEFRKLQLTLYALAVEQVLLAGRPARPLGLAYWLVTDSGPKIALPGGRKPDAWYEESKTWPAIREQLQRWVVELVRRIRRGQFALKPRSDDCTRTCDFSQICRINQVRGVVEKKAWRLELPTCEKE